MRSQSQAIVPEQYEWKTIMLTSSLLLFPRHSKAPPSHISSIILYYYCHLHSTTTSPTTCNTLTTLFLAWSFGSSIPATTANDLRLRRISIPLHYFLILILEKEPVFTFSMLSAKQGNYWYHFYSVFCMTRSLTGDWTRDLPYSMPALYH